MLRVVTASDCTYGRCSTRVRSTATYWLLRNCAKRKRGDPQYGRNDAALATCTTNVVKLA
eukprot:9232155-Pyramimonas_sp.AAC.2